MLSRTILAQSIFSEDQFIADLTSLFKRRNIRFGEPQDLEHLASDLASDEAFRNGLFNLCTVISHMTEVEFTPQELLVLVARASGGPRIFDAQGNNVIPHDTERAFLTGYESWTHRDPELEAASEHRHSEPFHEAMVRSAAEGSRTAPSPPSSSSPAKPAATDPVERAARQPHSRRAAPVSGRDRAPRKPDRAAPRSSGAKRAARPQSFSLRRALRTTRRSGIRENTRGNPARSCRRASLRAYRRDFAPAPEPELAAESIHPIAPAEEAPALAAVSIVSTEPPAPEVEPQATDAPPDTARLRRLRAANIILAILLIISTIFAGFVAFRYVNSRNQPANLAATPDQPPAAATEPASPPTGLQPTSRITPPPTHPVPAAKPSQAYEAATAQAASAATAPPDAVVFPPAAATPPRRSRPRRSSGKPLNPPPRIPRPHKLPRLQPPPPPEAKPAESTARPQPAKRRTARPPNSHTPHTPGRRGCSGRSHPPPTAAANHDGQRVLQQNDRLCHRETCAGPAPDLAWQPGDNCRSGGHHLQRGQGHQRSGPQRHRRCACCGDPGHAGLALQAIHGGRQTGGGHHNLQIPLQEPIADATLRRANFTPESETTSKTRPAVEQSPSSGQIESKSNSPQATQ